MLQVLLYLVHGSVDFLPYDYGFSRQRDIARGPVQAFRSPRPAIRYERDYGSVQMQLTSPPEVFKAMFEKFAPPVVLFDGGFDYV